VNKSEYKNKTDKVVTDRRKDTGPLP